MAITKNAKEYQNKMLAGAEPELLVTDPEFIELFANFAFDEVVNQDDLDDRTRFLAILASLLGCHGLDEYKQMLPAALNMGVTPVEAKEIVYQSVVFLGIARVFPFLKATNEVLRARGVKLPLASQSTTTREGREAAGEKTWAEVFGESAAEFCKAAPKELQHFRKWLADNCFGDIYTRKGLTLAEREMVAFCILAARGGEDLQLTSHVNANFEVGNDRLFLIKVVSQCLPYIGYASAIDAIASIEKASEKIV